jgi:RNA polymerase sigma-70 factor (ECF subfamily)
MADRGQALIVRIQQAIGQREAPDEALGQELDGLFAEHQKLIAGLCRQLVPDRQRADELTQETLLVAYRKLPEYRGDPSFSAWIVSLARQLCSLERDRQRDLLAEDGILDELDPKLSVLKEFTRAERLELVSLAAQGLSPLEQETVVLRYVHGVSLRQLTHVLQLHQPGGARELLVRIRRELRRALREVLANVQHGTSLLRREP